MAIYVDMEKALKNKGMTSKELAKLIGITEANLSLLKTSNVKGIRFNTLNKICYYLECDISDLLFFDGKLEGDD